MAIAVAIAAENTSRTGRSTLFWQHAVRLHSPFRRKLGGQAWLAETPWQGLENLRHEG